MIRNILLGPPRAGRAAGTAVPVAAARRPEGGPVPRLYRGAVSTGREGGASGFTRPPAGRGTGGYNSLDRLRGPPSLRRFDGRGEPDRRPVAAAARGPAASDGPARAPVREARLRSELANRSPDEKKEDVRRAADLVDQIRRTVPLKRTGRTWAACCPFHREKTPSFHVWPESQRWKCFGCQKSGDVFAFVMERDGVDFPEALRTLAREYGVSLDERADPSADEARRSREALGAAAEWACGWFQGNLRGSPAAEYLRRRGLTGETARDWRLGYAPESWEGLLDAGRRAGYAVETLESAGLVLRRASGDGLYDRFRNRVVFPIADARGRVVAFGARALGDKEPKYLNSPETPLFRKGEMLFGLHRARGEALQGRTLCFMEGYMDVIMAHQHGIRSAVAGLGTAFTAHHASLLRRFADRVVLIYDADDAGRRAAARAVEIVLDEDLDAAVATLPDGLDPCDLLVQRGPGPLRDAMDRAPDAFEFLVAAARERAGGTVAGVAAEVDGLVRTALRAPHAVRRERMLQRISAGLGVSAASVASRARAVGSGPPPREPAAPGAAAAATAAADPAADASALERLLLEAALAGPGLAARLAAEAPPETFAAPALRRIAAALVETADDAGTAVPAECAAALDDAALADLAAELAAAGAEFPLTALHRRFEECLERHVSERRLEDVKRRVADAQASGDSEAEDARFREGAELIRSKHRRAPRPVER